MKSIFRDDLTIWAMIKWWLAYMFMIGLIGTMSYLGGYYAAAGELPIFKPIPVAHVPPNATTVSFGNASAAIQQAQIYERVNREGYNCLDFAWDTMRALQWKGINSYISSIKFEGGGEHAMVVIPTMDRDLVWIEPQTGKEVDMHVGMTYNGQKVVSVQVLAIAWITPEQFKDITGDSILNGDYK